MGQPPERQSKSRWIKLYPGIFANNDLAKPYCEGFAWAWLLMRASSNEYRGLSRGQLRAGYGQMAAAWGWHRSKVRRFLNKLEKLEMISRKADTLPDTPADTPPIVLTVCNYSRYQDTLSVPDTPPDTPPDTHTKKAITKKEKYIASGRATPGNKPFVCAPDWRPADEMEMMMIASTEGVDYDQQLMRFRDYCQASGKAYKNHDAAFRNWLRSPYNKRTRTNGQPSHQERDAKSRAAIASAFADQFQDDGLQAEVPQIGVRRRS